MGYPLGSLVCDVFLCFCHFPMWCPGQLWHLIVSIPDLCLLTYFKRQPKANEISAMKKLVDMVHVEYSSI